MQHCLENNEWAFLQTEHKMTAKSVLKNFGKIKVHSAVVKRVNKWWSEDPESSLLTSLET